jgi:hypothetical protein
VIGVVVRVLAQGSAYFVTAGPRLVIALSLNLPSLFSKTKIKLDQVADILSLSLST